MESSISSLRSMRKIALVFFATLALVFSLRAEDKRLAFLADYETGLEAIELTDYPNNRFGKAAKTRDVYRYTMNAYRKAVDWHRLNHGVEGAALAKRVENSLSGILMKLFKESETKSKASGARYSNTMNLLVRIAEYDKAIRILLASDIETGRWRQLENCRGKLGGYQLEFEGGNANAVMPYRLFQSRPFIDSYEWIASFGPKEVFTFDGEDYVIVRFAYEDNLEGYPATTEERVLMKVRKGEIVDFLPLHNFLPAKRPPKHVEGKLVLEGTDGLSRPLKFTIDLENMKFIRSECKLTLDFVRDYGKSSLFE